MNKQQAEKKTVKFETEVSKLLDIVANSLYTEKEIFLRELVSNSSDACEKLRYVSQTDSKAAKTNKFEIKILILIGCFIWSNHAHTASCFNCHVANCHSLFHAHGLYARTGKLDCLTHTDPNSEFCNDP